MVGQLETNSNTNNKRPRSNDKSEWRRSKFYKKKLNNKIKEVHKKLSALTFVICKMDDTIRKQALDLYEIQKMLNNLVQVKFNFLKVFCFLFV